MIKDCLPSELTMRHLVVRSRKWKCQFSVNPSEQAVVRAGFRNLELFEKAALIRRAGRPFSLSHATSWGSSPVGRTSLLAPLSTFLSAWQLAKAADLMLRLNQRKAVRSANTRWVSKTLKELRMLPSITLFYQVTMIWLPSIGFPIVWKS